MVISSSYSHERPTFSYIRCRLLMRYIYTQSLFVGEHAYVLLDFGVQWWLVVVGSWPALSSGI